MLKYLSKITTDILPSVAATIIGAYIVNHYIATKPGTDAPAAAAVSQATPKKVDAVAVDVDNKPAAGVRAKGISEKAIFEKPVAEKPTEKSASAEKSAEKTLQPSEDKQAETASIPADSRRHPPHEKTVVRVIPLTATAPTVQSAASVAAPPTPAPTVEAAIVPDEHRDANDLARAAIQRLRGGSETASRVQDTIRAPDAGPEPHAASATQVPQGAAVRPLPPPVVVSTPPADSPVAGSSPAQPYPPTARADDPRRPIPPADIPTAAPIELRAEPVDASARPHTNVAEDMLLAAKSVFHAVLPQ